MANEISRYAHSLRQLINTTVANIAAHPLIKDPPIYYPIVNPGQEAEQVKIERYRTYDGIELIEPGLTLAVFPCYSSKTFNTGFRSSLFNSVKLEPYTLGAKSNKGFLYTATYYIAVSLYYADVSINNSINTKYYKSGKKVILDNLDILERPRDLIEGAYEGVPEEEYVEIEINPAEDILRDYLDLMRIVLDDIPRLYPFSIRHSQVVTYDYPTTSWLRENSDVYFHQAYLVWELGAYLPTQITFEPPVEYTNLSASAGLEIDKNRKPYWRAE